ncbi:MAG: GspH/FimT family pseudopilin [Pirellulaceae bacterium]
MIRQSGTSRNSAFTLVELVVVLALLGVVAVASTSMLGGARVVGSVRAGQESQVLMQTLRMARATAISSFVSVQVETIVEGRTVVGYRVLDPTGQLVGREYRFEPSVATNWSTSAVTFMPTGATNTSLTVSFRGDSADWVVDLLSASGQVSARKVAR